MPLSALGWDHFENKNLPRNEMEIAQVVKHVKRQHSGQYRHNDLKISTFWRQSPLLELKLHLSVLLHLHLKTTKIASLITITKKNRYNDHLSKFRQRYDYHSFNQSTIFKLCPINLFNKLFIYINISYIFSLRQLLCLNNGKKWRFLQKKKIEESYRY